jgi:hypothetical protein
MLIPSIGRSTRGAGLRQSSASSQTSTTGRSSARWVTRRRVKSIRAISMCSLTSCREHCHFLSAFAYRTGYRPGRLHCSRGAALDFDALMTMKEMLRASKSRDGAIVTIGDFSFMLQAYGSKSGFPLVLQHPDFTTGIQLRYRLAPPVFNAKIRDVSGVVSDCSAQLRMIG